jgi:hypothetical protein
MKGEGVRVFEVSECAICREDGAIPSRVLEPCGHKAICDTCINTLSETTTLCPMCQKPTTNLYKSTLTVVWIKFMLVFCLYVLWIYILEFHLRRNGYFREWVFLLHVLVFHITATLAEPYANIIKASFYS